MMCMVNEAMQDGICECWVFHAFVPHVIRHLAGDDDGAFLIPVIGKLKLISLVSILVVVGQVRPEGGAGCVNAPVWICAGGPGKPGFLSREPVRLPDPSSPGP